MAWVTLTLRKRELKQSHAYYQMRDLQISREKRQLARQKQYETAVIQNQQQHALSPITISYNQAIDELNKRKNELNEYLKFAREIAEGAAVVDKQNKLAVLPDDNGEYVKNSKGALTHPETNEEGETVEVKIRYSELLRGENGETFYWSEGQGEYIDVTKEFGKYDDLTRVDLYEIPESISSLGLPDITNITSDNISSIQTSVNSALNDIENERSDAQIDYTNKTNTEKTYWEGELSMVEEEVNDRETNLDLEQSDIESQMESVSQEMQAVEQAVSSEIQNSTIKLA